MTPSSSTERSSPADAAQGRWKARFVRFARHPVFPVLVFVLASKIIGEFYPLSPFSMYSNPSSVPLRYCYVANGKGEALPILWHCGQTPARLTKKHRAERSVIEERLGIDADSDPEADRKIRAEAGEIVLQYCIDLSKNRSKKRHLSPPLQLVEVAIHLGEDGKLHETPVKVAELPVAAEDGDS